MLLKSREDILSVCAVSCHFASGGVTLSALFQNVLERTWNAGTIHRETVNQTSFWPGALWEGILEQCAIRLLFCLLLFHRRFSVDLSHQIIENLINIDL